MGRSGKATKNTSSVERVRRELVSPLLAQPLVSSAAPVQWSLRVLHGVMRGRCLPEQLTVSLERLIAFSTSSHPSSLDIMQPSRGKIWSRVRAIIVADPSGTGVSPTISSAKAQSVHGVAGPAPGTTPGIPGGSPRLATRRCTQREESPGQ